jgi:hypothetical protein
MGAGKFAALEPISKRWQVLNLLEFEPSDLGCYVLLNLPCGKKSEESRRRPHLRETSDERQPFAGARLSWMAW